MLGQLLGFYEGLKDNAAFCVATKGGTNMGVRNIMDFVNS